MKKNLLRICNLFLLLVFIVSCTRKNTALFKKSSSDRTGIHFSNTITENDSVNVLNYYYCYNGGGVGIADFNNDGLPDIFFTGNMVSSKLYLNKGNMQFEDITASAGLTTKDWIMGVSLVDINHDGFMDIYLNVAGPKFGKTHHNLLYINQGNSTFKEDSKGYGLDDSSYCVQSAFFDYDRDGDLDMYLLTNEVDGIEKTYVQSASYPATSGRTIDKLYENVGDTLGHPYYRNVSKQAGIIQEGYGLGLAIDDLNGDGWPDVYAANDFMPNDQMLINQKNKIFKDVSAQSMRHQTYSGMGVDITDINNDAKPDIFVVDMLPEDNEHRKTMIARADYDNFNLRKKAGYVDEYMRNTLQLNQGTNSEGIPFYADISQLAGVNATDWSWSVLLADYDNDGYKDAYITNGFAKNITDLDFLSYNADANTFGTNEARAQKSKDLLSKLKGIRLSNYLFHNNGDLTFSNITAASGAKYDSYSNGAAYADLDNDGDLDLVVNNINEEAFVFENTASSIIDPNAKNHYLQITLNGSEKNRNGLGATVTLYCGKEKFYTYVSQAKGYLSSMNGSLHFGIGKHNIVDSLQITWPDGKSQSLKEIKPDQKIKLQYSNAGNSQMEFYSASSSLFSNANNFYDVHWKHIETEHNDFDEQPLLLFQNSKKGPSIAVADVDNKNGADFYVSGSANNTGTLFMQNKNGLFEQKQITEGSTKHEDMGAIFFDADNDNDQDLYIVSGGTQFKNGSDAYNDRLYLNDGNGKFTISENALPPTSSSGSCVVAADFDKDGDLDLFRSGAVSVGDYPTAPRSYLFKNDGGKFTDVTKELAPDLMNIGMVNAAVWTDFDNDGWIDLIVTGEWMSPSFFKNVKGKFINVTQQTGLKNMNGFWTSIYPADMDNDGDIDYILGNMGTNIDYKPSKDQPLELYYGNFDMAAKPEPVITSYTMDASGEKKCFPVAFRDDLFKHIPFLKKKFPNYELYSKAKLNDLFSDDAIANAAHYTANTFQSCILENKGNGKFVVRTLPIEAQFSCSFGIFTTDVDEDGNLDIILTGNSHSNEAVYGWMDASLGLLLKGDGKGNFIPVTADKSGLFLYGASRGLASLYDNKNREMIISVSNNDSLNILTNNHQKISQIISASQNDCYAEITFKNGKKRKQEFYYGAGYLSQQARAIKINEGIRSIELFDENGKSKMVYNIDKNNNQH